MTEIGKYVHFFLKMKNILNENTVTFRKSQVPAGFYLFFQLSYYRYKIQNYHIKVKITIKAVLVLRLLQHLI